MSLRTPLSRARYLGSAKEGPDHWWRQRLTAAALVPLAILVVGAVAMLIRADYATAVRFIASPFVAIVAALFVATAFWHLKLGVQVVVEDYVHQAAAKFVLLALNNFACVALAVACLYSIVKLALGAAVP